VSFPVLERWSALFLLLGTAAIYLAIRIAVIRLRAASRTLVTEWLGIGFITLCGLASMTAGAAGFWFDARLEGFRPLPGQQAVAAVVTLPRADGRFDLEWHTIDASDGGSSVTLLTNLSGDRWSLLGSTAEIRLPWMAPSTGPAYAMPERIVAHWADADAGRTRGRAESAVRRHNETELVQPLSHGGARGRVEPMLKNARPETPPLPG
jgi:hypothetical protein